jgi:hypothetical protein
MNDHASRFKPGTAAQKPAEEPSFVPLGGVESDRRWAQDRIRNHSAAARRIQRKPIGSPMAAGMRGAEGDQAHEPTQRVQGPRIQRKAEHGAEAESQVSHPDEPAEQEADRVSETVADQLHEGGEGKAEDQERKAPAEEAPPIHAH